MEDESVKMSEDVVLATDLLLDQMIFFLVVENDMDLLGSRTANVRT